MVRLALVAALAVGQASAADLSTITYDVFLREHGEARSHDTVGYETRARLFSQRLEAIQRHNANRHSTWTKALNKFADYTDEEFHRLLGYRRQLRRGATRGAVAMFNNTASASSFLQARTRRGFAPHQESLDWGEHSHVAIKDQLACGSCWAVAAATAMEMHAEITSKGAVPPTSFEQLVDCTPNKKNCGGTGGCEGATSELAFEYVFEHGLLPEDAYKSQGYRARGGGKPSSACRGLPGGLPSGSKPVIRTSGFVRLPENHLQPVYDALANGPLVVSVDATPWRDYGGGVFSGCDQNAIVNHAVVLTGFGKMDMNGKPTDYWLIRNSWGKGWGEKGHIKLQRFEADLANEQEGFCGEDTNPKEGVGCDGGAPKLKVCGMCGILSDVSYPHGVSYLK
eukprot:SRR837773.621.p1 GENE.SRR837773.621~~SRR837773.621.p1  ORF type:complete len:405 (+),score=57.58 SRR837773.621:26-1216(+)